MPPYRRKPAKRAQNKKRWFLDATLGKNVPLIGGSGFKLGSGTSALVKRAVKRELAKQEEIKTYSGEVAGGTVLKHNTIYCIAPQRLLGQGTNSDQRIGQQIYLRYIRLQGLISNLTTQPAVRFRFLCIRAQKDMPTIFTTWSDLGGLGSSELFYPSPSALVNSVINNKLEGIQILEDQQITVRSPAGGGVKDQRFTFDCRVMKKCTYKTQSFQDWNYYMVLIPYVDGGMTNTTVVGKVDLNYLVTFTDP